MNRLLMGLQRHPALAVGGALLLGVMEWRALGRARRRQHRLARVNAPARA